MRKFAQLSSANAVYMTNRGTTYKRKVSAPPLGLTRFPMSVPLKVPKCEIFDRSDFNDFYTIKSLCEGDFGVKIKKNYKNI